MQYNSGCIIGVEILTGATYPGTAAQNWLFNDGAWTPYANYSVPYSGYTITLPPGGNAILYGTYTDLNSRPDLVYPNNTYNLYVNNAVNTSCYSIGQSPRRLVITTDGGLEAATQNNRLSYSSGISGLSYVGGQEIASAKIVEVPYNQELTSYERRRTAPSMIEVTTLDGAKRQARTGNASTSIRATFKWSDDGTIAATVDGILELARINLYPLIVYIPAGIYYNGPWLDLVIPSNEPTVIMPAPGVYELTIEGKCQP